MIYFNGDPPRRYKPSRGGYLGGQMAHDGRGHLYGVCVMTGELCSVEVTKSQLEIYRGGGLAQNAFPDLTPEDREFVISGISPKGWDKIFERGKH